jgi:hypothetical protein
MSLQMSDLKALLDQDNVHYFEDPRRSVVLAAFSGLQGSYQLTIGLHVDGRFLQYRTLQYAQCPADSPHLHELLRLLALRNYETRWVKWAWDASDGEVVATGDMWVMDSKLTREQFQRMLSSMLQVIDLESSRIKAVIDTGKDPGEVDPDDLVKKLGKSAKPVTEV